MLLRHPAEVITSFGKVAIHVVFHFSHRLVALIDLFPCFPPSVARFFFPRKNNFHQHLTQKVIAQPVIEQTGFPQLAALHRWLTAAGLVSFVFPRSSFSFYPDTHLQRCPVIESNVIARDPGPTLGTLTLAFHFLFFPPSPSPSVRMFHLSVNVKLGN